MDGFESSAGVIVLAATNRPEVLDPALLRPGRFDRQIVVDMPDLNGREAILKVHMKKIRMDEDVSARKIAVGTPGLAGADLENLVNEAALLAARKNHDAVRMDDFHEAREKVMLGPERRSMILDDNDKKITAYHEAGHAVLSMLCKFADPTEKVTIIPRGQAMGVTFTPPEKDEHHTSQEKYTDKICVSLGGRAAEEIFIGRIHGGAYADIKAVTAIARTMVTQLGMSEALGPISYEEGQQQVFLGRDYGQRRHLSERTQQLIDDEVTRIVSEQLERARTLLTEHRAEVEVMGEALLERETLTRVEVEMILAGTPLPTPTIVLPDDEPAETPDPADASPDGTEPGDTTEPEDQDVPDDDPDDR